VAGKSPIPVGRLGLDTVVFIYFLEEHPDYLPFIRPLFEEADARERELVTSAITLLEVLVVPYRAGDLALAERYEQLLTRSRGIRLVDVDRTQLRATAQLRARYRIRTPDALQLSAALTHRCTGLVTNDRRFPKMPGLQIVQLSDLREHD